MSRLYLTILAIFAMVYSAVALPAIQGRQFGGDVVPVPISINITIGASNITFPAPNSTINSTSAIIASRSINSSSAVVASRSINSSSAVVASRTRRNLRSFPIDLPVPYKA